jgi:hypothetical protein
MMILGFGALRTKRPEPRRRKMERTRLTVKLRCLFVWDLQENAEESDF